MAGNRDGLSWTNNLRNVCMNLKNIWERPKPTGRDESKNNKVTKYRVNIYAKSRRQLKISMFYICTVWPQDLVSTPEHLSLCV